MQTDNTYTAFEGAKIVSRGLLISVVSNVKRKLTNNANCNVFIFSDLTGKLMDFNFQGTEKEVLKRLEVFIEDPKSKESNSTSGPGRPKLGVISREISLLPRHWEWLATQSGGASATLRKLIEEEMKKTNSSHSVKFAEERTYKFMTVIGGDFKGYEEAIRALYKKNKENFLANIKEWSPDIRSYVIELVQPIF